MWTDARKDHCSIHRDCCSCMRRRWSDCETRRNTNESAAQSVKKTVMGKAATVEEAIIVEAETVGVKIERAVEEKREQFQLMAMK